uniref:Uncharacterized protein n=1 Tax=Cacopsylla melanoneura TaxID=428564 RepID=A0A8D8UBI2_9HEMI
MSVMKAPVLVIRMLSVSMRSDLILVNVDLVSLATDINVQRTLFPKRLPFLHVRLILKPATLRTAPARIRLTTELATVILAIRRTIWMIEELLSDVLILMSV